MCIRDRDARSDAWLSRSEQLGVLLQSGAARDALHDRFDGILVEQAWRTDALALKSELTELGGQRWRGFSGTYRNARKQFAQLLQGDPPRELNEVLSILDSIIDEQGHSGTIREYGQLGSALFGGRWSSQQADWPAFREIAAYLELIHRGVASGDLPPETTATLADAARLAQLPQAKADALAAECDYATALAQLLLELDLDESVVFRQETLRTIPFTGQRKALQGWLDHLSDLHEMVGFNVAAAMCRSQGLESLVELAETGSGECGPLGAILEYSWYQALYERALIERP